MFEKFPSLAVLIDMVHGDTMYISTAVCKCVDGIRWNTGVCLFWHLILHLNGHKNPSTFLNLCKQLVNLATDLPTIFQYTPVSLYPKITLLGVHMSIPSKNNHAIVDIEVRVRCRLCIGPYFIAWSTTDLWVVN